MEKREQSKTITIKINGKHQAFENNRKTVEPRQGQKKEITNSETKRKVEENHLVDEKPEEIEATMKLTMPQDKITTLNASPKLEIKSSTLNPNDKQEKAVNSQDVEITREKEQATEDGFEWILPERTLEATPYKVKEIDEPKNIISQSINKQKKTSTKWFSGKTKINRGVFMTIFFAVFLAVILGTSFGLTMLKLVFIEKPLESELVQPVTAIPQGEQTTTEKTGGVVLVLPTISTWVIQDSAFSNSESAKTVVDEIKGKGISASIFEGEKSYILVGVADSKENAKSLGEKLAELGIEEPFAKEISAGGKELKGINEAEKAFLEELPSLFALMTKCSSLRTIDDSDLQKVNEYAKQLEKSTKIKSSQIKSLVAHSQAAIKNINSLAKKSDKKQSNELQQHLLTILSSYQELK